MLPRFTDPPILCGTELFPMIIRASRNSALRATVVIIATLSATGSLIRGRTQDAATSGTAYDGRANRLPLIPMGFVSSVAMRFATSVAAAERDMRVVDAARNGNEEAVTRLLKQRADVNACQADGATALHWAVYRD